MVGDTGIEPVTRWLRVKIYNNKNKGLTYIFCQTYDNNINMLAKKMSNFWYTDNDRILVFDRGKL